MKDVISSEEAIREVLAKAAEPRERVPIIRDGRVVGYILRAPKIDPAVWKEAIRATGEIVDKMVASWGLTEEELEAEIDATIRADRLARQNGS